MIVGLSPLAALRSAHATAATIVSLTFDDGRATAYAARPILASHGMHATFYVNSPRLGSSSFYMTWQNVQDLYSDGNEIGGHTAYHVNLPQVDPVEASRQICDDRVNLLNHGFPATDFAYPYGAYNAAVKTVVQNCGYNSARTTDAFNGTAESVPPQDPFAVKQVAGGNLTTMENAVTAAAQNGGGWVPVTFHDVCNGCSSVSVSANDLSSFLDWLQQQAGSGVVVETVQQVVGGSTKAAVLGPAPPAAPNATSTLRNASLEVQTNTDSAPDCWLYDDFGNNVFTWSRVTGAHSGTYAEQVTVTNYVSGDNKLSVLQDLGTCSPTVTPGRQYRLSTWYKSTNPVSFTVFARDTQWNFGYWMNSPDFPASSTWTQASWVTPAIPGTTNGLSFGLTLDNNGTLTVDDSAIVDASPTGPVDTTPPTVSLTAPTNGATVSGNVTISATASDNVAIDHLDFLVDGSVIGTEVNAPQSVSWNTRLVPNGSHTISVRAVDTAGNTTTTTPITAFVTNQFVNLLQNPSLESASGSTPTCWLLGGYGTNTFTWTRTNDAHSGSWAEALNISAYTSGDRKFVNTQDAGACAPAVTPGHTYTVSAWYKSTARPYVFAYYKSSTGVWTYWAQSGLLATAASWTQASWSTPAVPAGATNVSVGLGIAAVGSITMDDFALADNAPPPDTVPPTTTISCNATTAEGDCASGFYNAPVSITLKAVDDPGGSGLARTVYTTDGTDPTATHGTTYSGAFSVSTTSTVKYRSFDNAGNAEPVNTTTVRIDTVAPSTTITCKGAPCTTGFYSSAVGVTLTATDNAGGSGIGATYYTTDGTDPSPTNGAAYLGIFSVTTTTTLKFRSIDNAGNAEAVNTTLIQIDTVAPTTSISCNGTQCAAGFYHAAVSVALAAVDNAAGSGVAATYYTTDGTDPSTTNGTAYSTPFSVSTTATVKYLSYDNAGNAEPVNSALIQVDTTSPSVTLTNPADGSTVTGTIDLTATANDDSSVARVDFLVDGVTVGSSFGAPYSVSWSSATVGDGQHTVLARAFDEASNSSDSMTATIDVSNQGPDTIPPSSMMSCNGGACSAGFYNAAVSVSLSASDNAGGSGVARIVYTTDGSTPTSTNGTTYSGAFSVSSTTTVNYRAFDNAGNAEPVNTALIQIDTNPPTVTLTAPSSGSVLTGSTTLTATASDNVAVLRVDFLVDGTVVGSVTSSPYSLPWNSASVADGSHTIAARAVDAATNATTSSVATVTTANSNLLQNPSLETASGSTPTCWLTGGYGTNTYTWTRTNDAHTGSWAEALNITAYMTGDRKFVNTQDAGTCAPSVSAGHTYTVSAWYKSSIRPYIFAYYRNSSGAWVYWSQSAQLSSSTSWTQGFWTTPTVPTGATRLSVGLGIDGVGTITMDDFALFQAS
jgi:peptidoglycan/xylan/chitin deacetylase (PgdA/CDA1 family)